MSHELQQSERKHSPKSSPLQAKALDSDPQNMPSQSPPTFQLQADPSAEAEPEVTPQNLELVPGELLAAGEGNDAETSHVHWPNTTASGVTLGKGYDIGSRTAAEVIADLTAAGMSQDQATTISGGAGLTGQAAGTWVTENRDAVGEIALNVQYRLLSSMMTNYTDLARNQATSTETLSNNNNARSREVRDGVEAGTYVMSDAQWDNLHPAMVEFITDLRYQGGYYGWDRIAQINQRLIENDGNHLEQFRAVATLFESQEEGENSYMDNYGINTVGEGAGNTETFFNQTSEDIAGASTRRNRIRLSYLKQIISSLESGGEVTMAETGVGLEAEPEDPRRVGPQ